MTKKKCVRNQTYDKIRCCVHINGCCVNSSPPGQNSCRFADDILKSISLNEKNKFRLKFH